MKRAITFAFIAGLAVSGQALAKPAGANLITVRAWCPMTGASGVGRDAAWDGATKKAISACIANGGQPACCYKFNRQI
jgi:hypothetical protein